MGLVAAPLAADPPYIVTELSDEEGGSQSKIYDLNRYGQAVGWTLSEGVPHGTHWHNQVESDLHDTTHLELNLIINAGVTEAYGISDGDQIVGTGQVEIICQRTIIVYHAFLLRPAVLSDFGTGVPGDALTNLGTLGNPCTAVNSAAVGISNNNHVVGWSDTEFGTIRAFLVRAVNQIWYEDQDGDFVNDLMIDLGTLPGGAESSASDVNDAGVVTGYAYVGANYHAFVVTPQGGVWVQDANGDGYNDLMQSIGTLGGDNSWGRALNNDGHVVGESDTSNRETHAFFWDGTEMTDLGTLGGRSSSASAISDEGDIVGWAEDASGQRRAFLYRNGEMVDLNDQLLYGQRTFITLTEARAINDSGQIAGYGVKAASGGDQVYAFLLTPATAEQIAAAEEAQAEAEDAGSDADDGGSGGSGVSGTYSGTAITGTPGNLDGTPPGAAGTEEEAAGPTVRTGPCGFGVAGFLPLTVLGLACVRRRFGSRG